VGLSFKPQNPSREHARRTLIEELARAHSFGGEHKTKILRIFLFVATMTMVIFGLINSYVFDLVPLGLFELAVGVGTALLFVLVPHLGSYLLLAWTFVTLAGAVLFAITLWLSPDLITLIWSGIFPIVSFYLLGTRRGLVMHTLFFLLLLVALAQGWHNPDYVITPLTLTNVGGAGLAFGFLVYMYEKTRTDAIEMAVRRSLVDNLTRTGNRQMFSLMLENEKRSAQKHHAPLSLIMTDIDHFKSVNDRFGHIVGDKVLVEFTREIKRYLNRSSTVFRWGGEEFIILLPRTSLEEAVSLAEAMRHAIEEHPFDPAGRLTASFGVTQARLDETETDTIIRLDKALFQAKHEGRNRVVVA